MARLSFEGLHVFTAQNKDSAPTAPSQYPGSSSSDNGFASTSSSSPTDEVAASSSASIGVAPQVTTSPSQSSSPSDSGSSNTNVTQTKSESPTYSGGVLAGAIVGSVVGSIIITLLLTYLLLFKRERSGYRPRHRHQRSDASRRKPTPMVQRIEERSNVKSTPVDFNWQAYLPQPKEDSSIRHAVKTLFEQIELHVDNYYHQANGDFNDSTRRALIHVDSGRLPKPIEELMLKPHLAVPVIKHTIVHELITSISPDCSNAESLLPAYLSVTPDMTQSSAISTRERLGQYQFLPVISFAKMDKAADYFVLQPGNKPTVTGNP